MQLLYYKSVIPRFAEEREGSRGKLSTFKVSQNRWSSESKTKRLAFELCRVVTEEDDSHGAERRRLF